MVLALVFDTETTGIPEKVPNSWKYPPPWELERFDGARMLSIAWTIVDTDHPGSCLTEHYCLVESDFVDATEVHGITMEQTTRFGRKVSDCIDMFIYDAQRCDLLVGHNIEFDMLILLSECYRSQMTNEASFLHQCQTYCTKMKGTPVCRIVNPRNRSCYKWPTLSELHNFIFGRDFENAHHALGDVQATAACFTHMYNLRK